MTDLERLLIYLEDLVEDLEALDDEEVRTQVFDLVTGIDTLHRMALTELEKAIVDAGTDPAALREAHPAIEWLFDTYAVGVDEHAAADTALDDIRPYIHSHGGHVSLLDVEDGVVRVELSGSCSGCTASEITLREGVEKALREHYPGFVSLVVEEDEHAEEHPPPGPTLIELQQDEQSTHDGHEHAQPLLQIQSEPPPGFAS